MTREQRAVDGAPAARDRRGSGLDTIRVRAMGVVIEIRFTAGMSVGKWAGGLAGTGCAAAVVAFSWAPFATQDRTVYLQAGQARQVKTWTVWSDLALTGPLWAAVGLSALVAILSVAHLVLGHRAVLGRLQMFAAASSLAILAGYAMSEKYTFFDTPMSTFFWDSPIPGAGTPGNDLVPKHDLEPQSGWGLYAMLGFAAATSAVVWWNRRAPASRPRGHVIGDMLVFAGAATAAAGSLMPFLSTPEYFALPELAVPGRTFGAWAWNTFTAPLTWSVIIALTLASAAGFWQQLWPPAGGRWTQLYLAAYATLVMAGYAVSAKFISFGQNPEGVLVPALPHGPSINLGTAFTMHLQTGGWLMLAGSALALLGVVVAWLLAPRTDTEHIAHADAVNGPAYEAADGH